MPDANAWFRPPATPHVRRAGRLAGSRRAAGRRLAAVKAGVEAMPAEQRSLPDWTYWLGRAPDGALGNRDASRRAFERIAGHPTFYSILADEGTRAQLHAARKARASAPTNRAGSPDPGVQRALALFRLDMRTEGPANGTGPCVTGTTAFLPGAAQLAQQLGIYDRAINAADRTRSEHDYSLRYLAPTGSASSPTPATRTLDPAGCMA